MYLSVKTHIRNEGADGGEEAREQKQSTSSSSGGGCKGRGGGRLITVAGLVAWRRLGRGMPGCYATGTMQ